MSSIRPLATITLLAVAGFILYVKITETEPVIPEGVGDYEFNVGLDSGVGAPDPWSSPATVGSESSAPTFSSSAPATGEVGGAAPTWNPGAASVAPISDAPAFGSSAAAATTDPQQTAETPQSSEPAMPELPGEESTAASAVGSIVPAAGASAALNAYNSASDVAADVVQEPADSTALEGGTAATESTGTADRYGNYAAAAAGTAAAAVESVLPTTSGAPAAESLYAQSKVAIQSALDRGELSQALQMLSDWRGDPSLTPAEQSEVDTLLSQLAGSVIYSMEHRLEAPYMVQPGETLEDVAAKYQVSSQLLGKINGVATGTPLAPGQELKVVRGPFSALIDLSERELTLMLDRRYAGQFSLDLDSSLTVEDGQWEVVDKPMAPASATAFQAVPTDGVDRTVMLQNPGAASGQVAVLRGPGAPDPVAPEPPGRVIRLSSRDIEDVFDILSVGSKVTIRR